MRAVRGFAALLGVFISATVVAGPAHSASGPAQVQRGVRGCPADFVTLPPAGAARRAKPPRSVPRPPGVRVKRGTALYAVATVMARHRAGRVGYETLLGPTGLACSGVGGWEDDVSFATLVSPTHPSEVVSARFNFGQGGFSALCGYLAAAGRRAAAREVGHTIGLTVRQCRTTGAPDLPAAAHTRGVRLAGGSSAPFAVVISAPRGSETTWMHVTRHAKIVSGRRTTTPTVSVAVVKYKRSKVLAGFVSPQALDCSLPPAQRGKCVSAAQAFVSETMLRSFGWSAAKSAAAGRKVARALVPGRR